MQEGAAAAGGGAHPAGVPALLAHLPVRAPAQHPPARHGGAARQAAGGPRAHPGEHRHPDTAREHASARAAEGVLITC